MARRQQEIQKEAERQRKEVAERKFQERKAARIRRQEEENAINGTNGDHDSSRGSTPTPVPGQYQPYVVSKYNYSIWAFSVSNWNLIHV